MKKSVAVILLLVVIFIIAVVFKIVLLNENKEPEIIRNEDYIDTVTPASGGKIRSNATSLKESQPSGELKVYFFDVGQADSIFVQNNDACMLIDAGNNPDGKYISKFLKKELGIKKIDYLIGTHPHEDHIGGLDIIIQDFEIGNLYMPDRKTDNKSYTDVVKYATDAGIMSVSPNVGTTFKLGSAVCEIMTKNDNAEDINDTSIVIQITYGKNKFLFTGDILDTIEASRKWNDIDVLKVSHHGSTYSTKESFLKQTKPEYAIIMCGKDNDYHYPHEAVLERLEDNNCQNVYITSEDGTIFLISDGTNISVTKNALPSTDFDGNS